MQNLLAGEPQVAITLNLGPQLPDHGLLVPERIALEAEVLAPPESGDSAGLEALEAALTGNAGRTGLGMVFEIDLASAREAAKAIDHEARLERILPTRRIDLPPYEPGARLRLITNIIVHGSEILAEGNSPLCVPRVLHAWRENAKAEFMEVSYSVGRNPGPRIRFL
jgi:hypothetical protein